MKKWRDTYRNQFDQNRCREEARSAADWEKESMDMGEKKRSENALAETACIRKARSGLAVPAGVLLAGTAGILLAAVLPFSAWAAEKGWQTVEGTMRYVNEDGAMEKNTWIYEDGTSSMKKGWYYLGPDGKAEKNEWKKLGEVRYCFDSDGRMRRDIAEMCNGLRIFSVGTWLILQNKVWDIHEAVCIVSEIFRIEKGMDTGHKITVIIRIMNKYHIWMTFLKVILRISGNGNIGWIHL